MKKDKTLNSVGAPFFQKMLDDKKLIIKCIKEGKDTSELKEVIGYGRRI